MIATTVDRVPGSTAPHVNERIRQGTEDSVRYFSDHREEIDARLRELDAEWDIERVVETNSSVLTLLGLSLGVLHDRRWLALPIAVQLFMLQHALQGWCPPVPILRRLGFRTAYEIDRERYALKLLRGDFDRYAGRERNDLPRVPDLLAAVRNG